MELTAAQVVEKVLFQPGLDLVRSEVEILAWAYLALVERQKQTPLRIRPDISYTDPVMGF